MDYHDLLALIGEGSAHPGGFEASKRLLRSLEVPSNGRILEVGCGTGRSACYMAQLGYDVTAVDRNPLMLEKAKRRAWRTGSSVRFTHADAASLPFPDMSFDLVFVESVTIFTKGDSALQEYYRVLKSKGRLLDREMSFIRKTLPDQCRDLVSYYGLRHLKTAREWEAAVRKSRFREVKVSSMGNRLVPENNDFDPNREMDFRSIQESHITRLLLANKRLMKKYRTKIASVLIAANK
ncbi:class I SAM-dependent methyltransferase [Cohnella nanjingensis]|uniref:Class I SAM-dependent methyltransferase n=1 Tax=Cohnella nanjingensis TaxID=1387779 RepID=A0A7X0RKR9_9BACL|nr:class I SAM-dependent methyltransferase [Cohnella nanjingensis]MBB6669245.1 class I SAM-dependent methyltransferase [Cohnella nanjingensis]